MGNEKSLAHTRWNCKYHIVFAPKYRRQVFYREKRRAIGCIEKPPAMPEDIYFHNILISLAGFPA